MKGLGSQDAAQVWEGKCREAHDQNRQVPVSSREGQYQQTRL